MRVAVNNLIPMIDTIHIKGRYVYSLYWYSLKKCIHDFYEVSESHPPTCYSHCLIYQDSDTIAHACIEQIRSFLSYDSSLTSNLRPLSKTLKGIYKI
jgi:hypothetical protein